MYIDKNIYRKSKIVENSIQYYKDSSIPLMSVIEISDSGTCNRKCSFCPRSDPNFKDVKEFIPEKLHNKIFNELASFNYSGMVIYSGYVEPLLNKNIYRNLAFARKSLPSAKIELITNGDVLNVKRMKKLFEAGLSTLLISVYDGPEDMLKFQKMVKEADLTHEQYVIRNRYMSEKDDFGLTISNRSGMLKNAEYKIPELSEPLKKSCTYPAYTFFIDYNGDVQMCSHDWGKKYVLGNLNKNTIIDIWCNKKFDQARKNLLNGNRNFTPCNKCDVSGKLIGQKHAKEWKAKLKSNI